MFRPLAARSLAPRAKALLWRDSFQEDASCGTDFKPRRAFRYDKLTNPLCQQVFACCLANQHFATSGACLQH